MPVRTIAIMLLTCALVGWVAMAHGTAARQPTEATGPTAQLQPPEFPAVASSVVASLESAALLQNLAHGDRAGDSVYQPTPNIHIALARPAAEQAQLAATGAGGAPSSTSNMSYHGGPTQQTVAVYTIFWSPHGTISSSYRTLINRYFQDVGGSSFYNVVSQYPGLTGTLNVSTLGDTWIDTNPYPAGKGSAGNPLSNADIGNEVTRALSLNPSWSPASLGRTYFVYTEPGIESCVDPAAQSSNLICTPGVFSVHPYCAYHSAFGTINNPVIYANMPYGETWPGGCRGFDTSPNGDVASDGEISMSSHEQFEAVTDPLFNAWYDSNSSGEIGDKCAIQYGSIMPDGHNVVLNGHPYIVQLEWSNADNDGVTPFSGCVISSRATQKWGDFDCSGAANPVDSVKGLDVFVGIPVLQTVSGCPDFGSRVMINGVTLKWGDGDCNGTVDPIDSLKGLKAVAGIPVIQTVSGCPDFGSLVSLSSGASPTPGVTPSPTPSPGGTPVSAGFVLVMPFLFLGNPNYTCVFLGGAIGCTDNSSPHYTGVALSAHELSWTAQNSVPNYLCTIGSSFDCNTSDSGWPNYSCAPNSGIFYCSSSSSLWPAYGCSFPSSTNAVCVTLDQHFPNFACSASGTTSNGTIVCLTH